MPVCVWVCVQINVMVALYQKCDMMYRADPVFGAWCLVLTSQSKKKGCYSGLRSKLWPVSAKTIFLSSSNSKPFFFCGTSSLSNIATTTLAAGKKQTSNDRLHQKTRWMVPFWQFSLTCRETLPYMDQRMLNGCVCVAMQTVYLSLPALTLGTDAGCTALSWIAAKCAMGLNELTGVKLAHQVPQILIFKSFACDESWCVVWTSWCTLTGTCSACDQSVCVLWQSMGLVGTWWCTPVLCVTGTFVFCGAVCMLSVPSGTQLQWCVLHLAGTHVKNACFVTEHCVVGAWCHTLIMLAFCVCVCVCDENIVYFVIE